MHYQDNLEEIDKIKQRNLWALFFCNLARGFGTGMFMVLIQPFILELTGSILITGIIISIAGAVQFLNMPLVGKLSDRFGRKNLLLVGIFISILALFFLIISNPSVLHLLIIGVIFFYLGFSVENTNRQIFISENTVKSKGLMYGLMLFSYFGGTIGGNYFVFVSSGLSTRFFFQIFFGIFIVIWFVYFIFVSDIFQLEKNRLLLKNNSHKNMWREIFKNPKAKAVLIFLTFDIFIYSISLSVYTGGLRDFYSLTIEQLALLSMWFNISNMVFQIPAGRIADKLGNMKSLIISSLFGLGFFSINILGFYLWSGGNELALFPLLLFSHILFGINVSTFIPSEQILLTDLDEARKAESYGIVGFVRGIGYIPCGYIGGFLIENVHYIIPFIITFIGIFFEIWYLLRYLRD